MVTLAGRREAVLEYEDAAVIVPVPSSSDGGAPPPPLLDLSAVA
jgi:hypothetical protein